MAVVRTCQCQEHHQASGRDALHHFSVNLFHFDLFFLFNIQVSHVLHAKLEFNTNE